MKININKVSLSTLFSIIPILYFNSCMMGFVKNQTLILPMVIFLIAVWAIIAFWERGKIEVAAVNSLAPTVAIIAFLFLISVSGFGYNISSINSSLKNYVFILFFMLVFAAYSDDRYKNDRNVIVNIWCIDTVASCVYSIYRLGKNPLLSRYMSTGSFYEAAEAATVGGTISFGGVYGLVLVSVALISFVLRRKQKKLIPILLLIVFAILIIEAQFMISIILLIVSIFHVLIKHRANKRQYLTRILIVFVCGLILLICLPTIIDWTVETGLFGEAINERLVEIKLLLTGSQLKTSADIMIRFDKYATSVSAFWKSFCMGALCNKSVSAGGHSEILDGFANYGIMFFGFIFAFNSFYKYILEKLSGYALRTYKTVFGIYIIMSMINTSTWAPIMLILFVIIPFICLNEMQNESAY